MTAASMSTDRSASSAASAKGTPGVCSYPTRIRHAYIVTSLTLNFLLTRDGRLIGLPQDLDHLAYSALGRFNIDNHPQVSVFSGISIEQPWQIIYKRSGARTGCARHRARLRENGNGRQVSYDL
jgi:hypothetical protein